MQPIYIDIHIHTSDDPDNLNQNYEVETLFSKIRELAQGQHALISLTDHNTINKSAYLKAYQLCGDDISLLLGVELHIHYTQSTEAYHCHIFFKNPIAEETIDEINSILDELYPQKRVIKTEKSIPTLDTLINAFDMYDFILLPHGGQSHATFDTAIPKGRRFDTMMERSIYYNQFDGFTARSDSGREETDRYFKKLGISEFVNLVTCSDNYVPKDYPSAKAADAAPLIPTWMFAEPTFEGFRLSLSEKTRLTYSHKKPESWSEYIESVKYSGDKLDIDVKFCSGLNVVIGGSSSGKTLLVDSLWRILAHQSFEDSHYNEFGVKDLNILNPSGIRPHYLSQNYIMQVVGDDDNHKIEDIDIIRSLFPDNKEVTEMINTSLSRLKDDITKLIQTVEDIKTVEDKLSTTSQIGRLLVLRNVKKNIISGLMPSDECRSVIKYSNAKKTEHIRALNEIKDILERNPFVSEQNHIIDFLIHSLQEVYKFSETESSVYTTIKESSDQYAISLRAESQEDQTKTQEFNVLLDNIGQYIYLNRKFTRHLNSIAAYNVNIDTKEIASSGHHLYK